MEPKISMFIIALILVSLSAGVFGLFMNDVASKYPSASDYNNNSIDIYNKLADIQADTKDIQNATLGIKERVGITDIVGNYITGAYAALKITFRSFNIFTSLSNHAFSALPLGPAGSMINSSLTTIVLILIVVSIALGALIKKVL